MRERPRFLLLGTHEHRGLFKQLLRLRAFPDLYELHFDGRRVRLVDRRRVERRLVERRRLRDARRMRLPEREREREDERERLRDGDRDRDRERERDARRMGLPEDLDLRPR